MKIPVTLQPLLAQTQRDIPSLLKQLQVGQVVPAKVLAQLRPNLVRLQIATMALVARTPVPLQAGTQLRLELVRQDKVPELRILGEPGSLARAQRHRLVRSAVARQLPAAEVRQAASDLRSAVTTPRQHEAVQRLQSVLRDAGVEPARITPRQVQRAVMHSGVFHEARLLAGMPVQQDDVKTRLLQLLKFVTAETRPAEQPARAPDGDAQAQARPPGPDALLSRLVRLVESAVARIQLQQSVALPSEDSPRQAWQLDLPIQLPDSTEDVMLRIERDAEGSDDSDGPGWSVKLAFTFDSIGTLQCQIGLLGDSVTSTFWCDRATTHARMQQRLPTLKQALEAQGLQVSHLAGILGEPAQPLVRTPLPDKLLDERA